MTAAPAVMTRADLASPSATASDVVAGPVVLLLDPGQQEHLVVHREPEQDREDPDGQLDRHRSRLRDPDQVAERTAADSECQHAERGRDRQQVHDHGLERHQDRAEHHHQQHERHQQDATEEQRQPVGGAPGRVEVRRDHPADVDGQAGACDGGRDAVVAKGVDQVLGCLVLGRRGGHDPQQRGVARGVERARGRRTPRHRPRRARSPTVSAAPRSVAARLALDGEHHRRREARAETVREQVVGLARREVGRVVLRVREAEAHAEERCCQREQHGEPADRGGPRPALDEAAPAVPARRVVRVRVPAHERHVQPLDVATGEAEQGGQQRHRRDHDDQHVSARP